MQWMSYALAFLAVLATVLAGTGATAAFLKARAILDRPNERSSHKAPTPRGGGIAVMAVLGAAWPAIALVSSSAPGGMIAVLGAAAGLAALSWIDDLRGLHPFVRLAAQFTAAAVAILAIPAGTTVFQELLPLGLDRAAAVVLWVWFVNLFNFMDGIDGIAGTESAFIGAGLFLLAVLFPHPALAPGFGFYALTLAAAALGFLWWNWEPAKIFLGDVGSVPLGFLLGFLLLDAAAAGFWQAALILPLYYLADSGITLAARVLRGEKLWQAHARHFYQRAARRLRSHAKVVRAVILANLCLVALALVSVEAGWPALAGAGAAVAGLLAFLGRGEKPAPAKNG
jgi:UDP-N-acetylmuramyl pentapeptide phosphotransferase/UDP-N-acetylglucosamine-1-phosphate transferase